MKQECVSPARGRDTETYKKRGKNLSHQAFTEHVTHRLGPVVNAKLRIDVLDMISGGDMTDMQRVRQGPGVETLGEQFQNLPFTASKPVLDIGKVAVCSFPVVSRMEKRARGVNGPKHENRGDIIERPGNGHDPHIHPDRSSIAPADLQIEILNGPALQQGFPEGAIRATEIFSLRVAAAKDFVTFSPRRRRIAVRKNFGKCSILINDVAGIVNRENRVGGAGKNLPQARAGKRLTVSLSIEANWVVGLIIHFRALLCAAIRRAQFVMV
jgi:hypothetical protein